MEQKSKIKNKQAVSFIISTVTVILCIFALSFFFGDIVNSVRINENMNIYLPYKKHLVFYDEEINKTIYLDNTTMFVTRLNISEAHIESENLLKDSFIIYGSNKAFLITVEEDNQIPKTTD